MEDAGAGHHNLDAVTIIRQHKLAAARQNVNQGPFRGSRMTMLGIGSSTIKESPTPIRLTAHFMANLLWWVGPKWHSLDATLCIHEDVRLVLSSTKSACLTVAEVLDSCVVLEVWLSPANMHCLSHASDSPRTSVNRHVQILIHHFFGISHVSGHTEKFRRQDLDLLYARIAAAQSSQPDVDAVQHAALRPTLRPYQKQVVSWMLKREEPVTCTSTDNFLYTPLVDCYGKLLYYNKYAGFFVEKKMDFMATCRPGGILADEMGLGKTVEMLACILLHPMPPTSDLTLVGLLFDLTFMEFFKSGDVSPTQIECLSDGEGEEMVQCPKCHVSHRVACHPGEEQYLCPHCWVDPTKEKIAVKSTLIVSPSSISFQWLEEIERHQKDNVLRVMEYRGVQDHGFVSPLTFSKYDIVLTTYEVLKKELHYTNLPHVNSEYLPLSYDVSVSWSLWNM
ncbi:hypothetical protein HPB51_015582 [Rhipicephalus microplus]|uniref:SNF2 N-terminal domain-containing protein n=1 Tax=Rhipicephalus microplus TaxID=6941 RepID=A0A9J6DHB8_RHIMP|nr:hypothetical protein HPB51_015582 [Rhipicephalus microplus]